MHITCVCIYTDIYVSRFHGRSMKNENILSCYRIYGDDVWRRLKRRQKNAAVYFVCCNIATCL